MLKQHSLGVRVVFGYARSKFAADSENIKRVTSSDRGVIVPLLPYGTPPPLGIEFAPPKMRDLLLNFIKNFGNRTHITKRMPVSAECRSWGEEGDSTRTSDISA